MIDMGIVRGSKKMAVPLYVGKTTVYVHTDIHEVEIQDDDGSTYIEYEYHEYQYEKDEYIFATLDQQQKEINSITPYTETKTAYIGDTEVTFYTEQAGKLTVFFDKPYTVERLADRIIVSFEELEEVTEVTISIL